MSASRFSDQHKRQEDFYSRVLVVCPACQKKAIATVNNETNTAQLVCVHCGHHKTTTTTINVNGNRALVKMPAHRYFDAALWLQHSFKNEVFWAYNLEHLIYLEQYISAKLREHKNRTHFTLLEKLPKFYHEAKNREALLKIIEKLKLTA